MARVLCSKAGGAGRDGLYRAALAKTSILVARAIGDGARRSTAVMLEMRRGTADGGEVKAGNVCVNVCMNACAVHVLVPLRVRGVQVSLRVCVCVCVRARARASRLPHG